MEGILLIVSSTRMSFVSVDHAIKESKTGNKPLYVTFIFDSDLADSIFDKLTMEGFIGDSPGERVRKAVLEECEIRGSKSIEEIMSEFEDIHFEVFDEE
jgi:hypothetical protein